MKWGLPSTSQNNRKRRVCDDNEDSWQDRATTTLPGIFVMKGPLLLSDLVYQARAAPAKMVQGVNFNPSCPLSISSAGYLWAMWKLYSKCGAPASYSQELCSTPSIYTNSVNAHNSSLIYMQLLRPFHRGKLPCLRSQLVSGSIKILR